LSKNGLASLPTKQRATFKIMKRPLCILLISAYQTLSAQSQSDHNLNVHEFKQMIDSLQSEIILDLRTPGELKKGVIENATNIDYFAKDFEKQISSLDRTTTYFLYCASGVRSGETKEFMEAKGFKQVYHLTAGFEQWRKEKMTVAPFKRQ
jgi:phage shock protein E